MQRVLIIHFSLQTSAIYTLNTYVKIQTSLMTNREFNPPPTSSPIDFAPFSGAILHNAVEQNGILQPAGDLDPYNLNKVLDPYHKQRTDQLFKIVEILRANPEAKIFMPSPSMIEIDLTDGGCNQGCGHCCFDSGVLKNLRKIDEKILIPFLYDAFKDGTRAFELVGGGEPTVHKKISEIIDSISSFDSGNADDGPHIGLVTNGVLLNRVFPNIEKGQLEWIRVSLDSAFPETYDKLHGVSGKNHFHKVLNNLQQAIDKMDAVGKRADVGIAHLVVPPHNHTRTEILATAALAAELGVGHITFRPIQTTEEFDDEMWTEARAAIIEARNTYGDKVTVIGGSGGSWDYVGDSAVKETGACIARPLVGVVQASGDLASCFLMRDSTDSPPFGNIADGYDKAWKENSAHVRSYIDVDRQNCPNVCKMHRTNGAALEGHNNPSSEQTAHPDQKHVHFI